MTSLPSYIDPENWAMFVEVRKDMKKIPFTPLVQKKILMKLMRFHNEGYDANAILEKSGIMGWRDVFPDDKLKIKTSAPDKDPAITKIEQDALKAAPMPSYIRDLKSRLRA